MLTAESRAALVAEFDLFRGAETLRPLLALTSRDFMPPILAAGFQKTRQELKRDRLDRKDVRVPLPPSAPI
jgi:hypothetical protein